MPKLRNYLFKRLYLMRISREGTWFTEDDLNESNNRNNMMCIFDQEGNEVLLLKRRKNQIG